MKRQHFIVTSDSEVIISRRAATLGGQSSLDYLPGAVFLGAAAAKLYKMLGQEDAYTTFHSGQVRFGNAYPVGPDGQATWPVPLSWHTLKKEDWQEIQQDERLTAKRICNKLFQNAGREQMDSGYIGLDGNYFRPKTELRLKTAVDPITGRAADRQLFGYAGLPAGLRFRFTLSADDGVSSATFDCIVKALKGRLRIGRSRSAEYGGVHVETMAAPPPRETRAVLVDDESLAIWLLSDTALLDSYGRPTLTPTASHFKLPTDSSLQPQRSFILSRSYAPFNAHLRHRSQERLVLRQGSVLTFRVPSDFDVQDLAKELERGVGLYRQDGLGQVWVNPPLLGEAFPELSSATEKAKADTTTMADSSAPETPPPTALTRWLQAQVAQTAIAREAEGIADAWAAEIRHLYATARQLAGRPPDTPIGPTATQWGRIMELAKVPRITVTELKQRLLLDDNAVCKAAEDPAWGVEVWPEETEPCTFRAWLLTRCEDLTVAATLPTVLALTARRAMTIVRAEEQGDLYHAG